MAKNHDDYECNTCRDAISEAPLSGSPGDCQDEWGRDICEERGATCSQSDCEGWMTLVVDLILAIAGILVWPVCVVVIVAFILAAVGICKGQAAIKSGVVNAGAGAAAAQPVAAATAVATPVATAS